MSREDDASSEASNGSDKMIINFQELEGEEGLAFLSKVFKKFDRDGSGEIDEDELQKALQYMGMKAKPAVVKQILTSIDVDNNGVIDEDEFLEFFAKVRDIASFKANIKFLSSKLSVWSRIMQMYSLMTFILFCVFVMLYIKDKEGSQAYILWGLILSGVMLASAVCLGVMAPLCSMWFMPQQNADGEIIDPVINLSFRRKSKVQQVEESETASEPEEVEKPKTAADKHQGSYRRCLETEVAEVATVHVPDYESSESSYDGGTYHPKNFTQARNAFQNFQCFSPYNTNNIPLEPPKGMAQHLALTQ